MERDLKSNDYTSEWLLATGLSFSWPRRHLRRLLHPRKVVKTHEAAAKPISDISLFFNRAIFNYLLYSN